MPKILTDWARLAKSLNYFYVHKILYLRNLPGILIQFPKPARRCLLSSFWHVGRIGVSQKEKLAVQSSYKLITNHAPSSLKRSNYTKKYIQKIELNQWNVAFVATCMARVGSGVYCCKKE